MDRCTVWSINAANLFELAGFVLALVVIMSGSAVCDPAYEHHVDYNSNEITFGPPMWCEREIIVKFIFPA